jgi:hypothetical protein
MVPTEAKFSAANRESAKQIPKYSFSADVKMVLLVFHGFNTWFLIISARARSPGNRQVTFDLLSDK